MIVAARDRLEGIVAPLGLALLAAALRLPDLATRGTWDGDQGHDMLVLRALVRDGVVPLLGPPTSIGDVHHGALYYYLLAPAAALTGGESPLAVALLIALAGIVAVIVTWWLARSIAGPIAGVVAGLAMAVSPASIDESTFIWNPNLIGLSSALALAWAWHAWTTRRLAWWLLAAAGTAVTMQAHVLGIVLLPVIAALLVADIRRRTSGAERWALLRVGAAGLGLIALTFVPLVVHELATDFAEVHAALAYLRGGGDPPALDPLGRFAVIGTRVVSWPLIGLIADGIAAALLSFVGVLAIALWRSLAGLPGERTAVRWLGLGLVWTAFGLTIAAPGLAVVVRGLPNDHYHAFADPMVFALIGIGVSALWPTTAREAAASWSGPGSVSSVPGLAVRSRIAGWAMPGRILAAAGLAAILAWAATHQPPAVNPDGGYPAAVAAAGRIETEAGPGPIRLRSLPTFKSVEAYAYPLVVGGRDLQAREGGQAVGTADLDARGSATAEAASLVVICDSLFASVIGAACGGPAEATIVPDEAASLIDRFEAAPGRTVSIYRVASP